MSQLLSPELVGVVVVHWRGMDDTTECLESLAASTTADLRVAVVVNGFEDFDAVRARAAFPRVEILQSDDNEGYAAACNRGIAALSGAGIVVLVNNDVVFAPNALSALAKALADDPDAALAGPIVTYYHDPKRIWSAGGWIHPWLGYTRHVAFGTTAPPATVTRVDFINGCVMAFSANALTGLRGLDTSYFHYFEDTDVSARAREAGHTCIVVPTAAVRHKVSASAGQRGSNRMNATQAYYFARNRVLFVRRNFIGPRRVTATIAQPLLVLYEIAKDLRENNVAAARARVGGIIDGLRGRTGAKDSQT